MQGRETQSLIPELVLHLNVLGASMRAYSADLCRSWPVSADTFIHASPSRCIPLSSSLCGDVNVKLMIYEYRKVYVALLRKCLQFLGPVKRYHVLLILAVLGLPH